MAKTPSRFLVTSGREVFTGNELLIKGCLEAEGGVSLYSGYPGSPIAGFFDCLTAISPLLKEHGVRAFQANNEALGAAALNGLQMAPARGIIAMKSVGVHVAADALAIGNLAGTHPAGGAIVVAGDDPWCDSTQVPADSRYLFEHMRMPVVEPGDIQQLKDWINLSFKLSQASSLYVGYVVTTALADGGGSVECFPHHFPAVNACQRFEVETEGIPSAGRVMLPPFTWQNELKLPARLRAALDAARRLGINRILGVGEGHAPIGFIVTGCASYYLQQLLAECGLSGRFPILEMGMSYPADATLVETFSHLCHRMIVIEERRGFLEKNIREALAMECPQSSGEIAARLFGKRFPAAGLAEGQSAAGIPETRGLNPSVLALLLLPYLQRVEGLEYLREGRPAELLRTLRSASAAPLNILSANVVRRSATFCPGCPHRDSAGVLLQIRKNLADAGYMQAKHRRQPVDLVAHGDTGCYSMLFLPPNEPLMHNYSGMGLGAGTGTGIDPFITNKQLVFMGDSTFFHSGQIAITNAVKSNQDITFIILENGTTAMTGHQTHAGTETDLMGNPSPMQDIQKIVQGMAASAPMLVEKLRPDDRDNYCQVLESAILRDGVKVIIADKECGITHHRSELRQQREQIREFGFLPRQEFMNLTPDVCENCLECTKQTGCPGLMQVETDYGRKIDTDLTWCVSDGACERVRVSNGYGSDVKPCPSFEKLTLVRSRRRRYNLPHLALDKLPEPEWTSEPSDAHPLWRVHMSGVGGMGIGLVSAILVRAGHKQGYHVIFSDRKGLAIRNGGVFSQITFTKKPRQGELATTAHIPYGQADVLLGIDILEAARAVDPRADYRIASPNRTAAVLNTYKQATIETLMGRADFDPAALREAILKSCLAESSYVNDLSTLCERRLGSKQFVNIMMLGVAFQLGLIPVSAHSIAWAIKDSVKREHRRNLKAFNIGRKLALEPRALPPRPEPVTWEQFITSKLRVMRRDRYYSLKQASWFERLAHIGVRHLKNVSDRAKYDLVVRVYDLLQHGGVHYAKRYIDLLEILYRKDSFDCRYAATCTAIHNLAKVMLIKDEPYVAYLLTRPEKLQKDIEKYNVDLANGDRVLYEHYTSPELGLGRFRFRLKLRTRNWQLRLVRKMRFLRRLPTWHARETAFREWYIGLLEKVDLTTPTLYDRTLAMLKCPEEISGYREIRYPKMDAARAKVEALLASGTAAAPADAPAAPADAPAAPASEPASRNN